MSARVVLGSRPCSLDDVRLSQFAAAAMTCHESSNSQLVGILFIHKSPRLVHSLYYMHPF